MKGIILFSFSYFTLSENSLFVFNGITFSNDKKVIDDLFIDQNFLSALGRIQLTKYKESDFAYCTYPYNHESSEALVHAEINKALQGITNMVQAFLSILWLVDDHSCSVTDGVAKYTCNKKPMFLRLTSHSAFTNAEGDYKSKSFTLEQLNEAVNLYNKFSSICKAKSYYNQSFWVHQGSAITKSMRTQYKYNENSVVERAFHFLTSARTTDFLPSKISLYMSVLECLFSTNASEVTYKMALRISYYLGGENNEKYSCFKTIVDAYDIRSSYYHGRNVKSRFDLPTNIKVVSRNIDNILRKILNKVILEDYKLFENNDLKDEYFNNIVCGLNPKIEDLEAAQELRQKEASKKNKVSKSIKK